MEVKNSFDELWIAVKFQSNSAIAGSIRNTFWCSLAFSLLEVETLFV